MLSNEISKMQLWFPATTTWSNFALEAHATCHGHEGGRWVVKVVELWKFDAGFTYYTKGGQLSLFINHELNAASLPYGHKHVVKIGAHTGTNLRLVLTPSVNANGNKEGGYAVVKITAGNVDLASDTCMATKDCLNVFGSSPADAANIEIRNVNEWQFQCLANGKDVMPDRLKQRCEDWLECLHDILVNQGEDKRSLLVAMLGAALGKSSTTRLHGNVQIVPSMSERHCQKEVYCSACSKSSRRLGMAMSLLQCQVRLRISQSSSMRPIVGFRMKAFTSEMS